MNLPLDEALDRFRGAVNRDDTIFSTDHWLTPKLALLRERLSDPINSEQALALDDVLHGNRYMKDLFEWLNCQPMTWAEFFPYREKRDRDALSERVEEIHRNQKPCPFCPMCGSSSVVPILYGYMSELAHEAGRRGYVVLGGCTPRTERWICKQCRYKWPEGAMSPDEAIEDEKA